ncbi:tyrosine-type recombinase/integrase [Conexibacter woesei]|uniref:Integrase family protein n=1 Tax=Conexibacter woesei (strain DSM 14684 / CCUG 47730 / CIP 108061 / JCM 11494 / NBRC 100937 / ID131577) TaxID=469383 RepID=D3F472_CONWI|nr:site-specific integrase [Conexibacter woesei]ADB50444.1 integrase family protein [Conexibacter woesei DSM 14684]
MSRSRNGQVIERRWKSGRGYALRFLVDGRRQYLTLGLEHDGWTRARAEEELLNVMADVRRGIWIPPARGGASSAANGKDRSAEPGAEVAALPTFHEFATDWLARREGEVAPRTVEYERWALTHHLLPHFAHTLLDAIDIATVDDYRRAKVAESDRRRTAIEVGRPLRAGRGRSAPTLRPLSPGSINKTIDVLQAVLALAREYGHIADNPATGRRRRLKASKPRPVHLDAAEPIQALLDAAATLDADTRHRMRDRHAIIATLLFAGLRAHELCQLRWRDIDLTNARLQVSRSKTDAGRRTIELLPILRATLTAHKRRSRATDPDDLVFPTGTGGQREKDNLRNRVLQPTIPVADRLLAERDHPPLPRGLTPHKLRHTYASILVACGTDPATVMAQLGHTDPHFTLRAYAHVMRRVPAERARLDVLVARRSQHTGMGTSGSSGQSYGEGESTIG